jgi:hypothetical protein
MNDVLLGIPLHHYALVAVSYYANAGKSALKEGLKGADWHLFAVF